MLARVVAGPPGELLADGHHGLARKAGPGRDTYPDWPQHRESRPRPRYGSTGGGAHLAQMYVRPTVLLMRTVLTRR